MPSIGLGVGGSPPGMQASAKPVARRATPIFGIGRFDFCMTPRDPSALVKSAPSFGLCGAPLCSGAQSEAELSVLRMPRCDMPRCGHCASADLDLADTVELSLVHENMPHGNVALHRNLQLARVVIREIFSDLELRCVEERTRFEEGGQAPPRQKVNQWAAYTSKARLQRHIADCLEFVKQNPDCRCRTMSHAQLRFYILLQHFVSEDTMDFYRPEHQRKHQDYFEGRLTKSVNAQVVKDVHRSEFTIEGRNFSLQGKPQDADGKDQEERLAEIIKHQDEFLLFLETFLLDYCQRHRLSPTGRERFIQAVTTQMCQAGLANMERCSQVARYYPSSVGLTLHTAYNLATHDTPEWGETLKLTLMCMKSGFSQYLDREESMRVAGASCPRRCGTGSYLYQYATLCFRPGPTADSTEGTVCTLLDALDEVYIEPLPG